MIQTWISSTADKMLTPVSLYSTKLKLISSHSPYIFMRALKERQYWVNKHAVIANKLKQSYIIIFEIHQKSMPTIETFNNVRTQIYTLVPPNRITDTLVKFLARQYYIQLCCPFCHLWLFQVQFPRRFRISMLFFGIPRQFVVTSTKKL